MSPAVAGLEFNRTNPSTLSSMYVKSQTKLPWLKTFIGSAAIIALLKKEGPYQPGPKELKNLPPSHWSSSYIGTQ
jgi:hypothetical protein